MDEFKIEKTELLKLELEQDEVEIIKSKNEKYIDLLDFATQEYLDLFFICISHGNFSGIRKHLVFDMLKLLPEKHIEKDQVILELEIDFQQGYNFNINKWCENISYLQNTTTNDRYLTLLNDGCYSLYPKTNYSISYFYEIFMEIMKDSPETKENIIKIIFNLFP